MVATLGKVAKGKAQRVQTPLRPELLQVSAGCIRGAPRPGSQGWKGGRRHNQKASCQALKMTTMAGNPHNSTQSMQNGNMIALKIFVGLCCWLKFNCLPVLQTTQNQFQDPHDTRLGCPLRVVFPVSMLRCFPYTPMIGHKIIVDKCNNTSLSQNIITPNQSSPSALHQTLSVLQRFSVTPWSHALHPPAPDRKEPVAMTSPWPATITMRTAGYKILGFDASWSLSKLIGQIATQLACTHCLNRFSLKSWRRHGTVALSFSSKRRLRPRWPRLEKLNHCFQDHRKHRQFGKAI